MALIDRAAVQQPLTLDREIVPVPELGGDVIVTELPLSDRLDFEKLLREDFGPPVAVGGASPTDQAEGEKASRRSIHAMVPQLLARAVLASDGQPLFHVEQWQAWGAKRKNKGAAIGLFNTAMRLNGFDDADNAKN